MSRHGRQQTHERTPERPPAPSDEGEGGQVFALEIQRHAKRPRLWRLRVRHVAADGTTSISNTEWADFRTFSPDLLLAQGRLKRFIFGDGRQPERAAPTSEP